MARFGLSRDSKRGPQDGPAEGALESLALRSLTARSEPLGSLAKAYQVKQVRHVIVHYKLAEEQDGE